jgi:hypothetical protein
LWRLITLVSPMSFPVVLCCGDCGLWWMHVCYSTIKRSEAWVRLWYWGVLKHGSITETSCKSHLSDPCLWSVQKGKSVETAWKWGFRAAGSRSRMDAHSIELLSGDEHSLELVVIST